MVVFCPHCGTLLLLEQAAQMRFYCPACPYIKVITKPILSDVELKRKETRVILGGKENWKNAATTSGVRCDKCQNTSAYYRQIQIRSADEPMTTFYRCTKCSYEWKED